MIFGAEPPSSSLLSYKVSESANKDVFIGGHLGKIRIEVPHADLFSKQAPPTSSRRKSSSPTSPTLTEEPEPASRRMAPTRLPLSRRPRRAPVPSPPQLTSRKTRWIAASPPLLLSSALLRANTPNSPRATHTTLHRKLRATMHHHPSSNKLLGHRRATSLPSRTRRRPRRCRVQRWARQTSPRRRRRRKRSCLGSEGRYRCRSNSDWAGRSR